MAPEEDEKADSGPREGAINVRIGNEVGDVDKTKVSGSDLRGDGANNQIGKEQKYQAMEGDRSQDLSSASQQERDKGSLEEKENQAKAVKSALQEVTADAGPGMGGAQTASSAQTSATLEAKPPQDFSLKELPYFTVGTIFKIWHPKNAYLHDMTFVIVRSFNVDGSIARIHEFESENEAQAFLSEDNVELHHAELREELAQTPRTWEDEPLTVRCAKNRKLKECAFVELKSTLVLNFKDPLLFVKNRGGMGSEQLARLQEKIRRH